MPLDSLGEYLDPQVLDGHVKLEAGPGIALTRSDAHNAIIITATLALLDYNFESPPALAGALFQPSPAYTFNVA